MKFELTWKKTFLILALGYAGMGAYVFAGDDDTPPQLGIAVRDDPFGGVTVAGVSPELRPKGVRKGDKLVEACYPAHTNAALETATRYVWRFQQPREVGLRFIRDGKPFAVRVTARPVFDAVPDPISAPYGLKHGLSVGNTYGELKAQGVKAGDRLDVACVPVEASMDYYEAVGQAGNLAFFHTFERDGKPYSVQFAPDVHLASSAKL
ncbi:hypothetical protein VI06_10915 [Aquitalea magnusonii]|jgi:hypothetical protein|nr:hypothetical protein VI06_10915 [Aquitalea magnusonii]